MENAVKVAVETVGGVTKTSNILGISNGAVHAWIKKQRVPNIDYARRLSELSNVPILELRPIRAT